MRALAFAARNGPAVLLAGLVAGVAAPGLGAVIRPWIPQIVVLLLFLAALRTDPRAFVGGRWDLGRAAAAVLALQLALPLAVLGAGAGLGVSDRPWLLALALMSAAAPIVGSPNMALMLGLSPVPGGRLLLLGTALLPLTVLPLFAALPALGGAEAVAGAALRLLAVILGASVAAAAVRRLAPRLTATGRGELIDGASALTLAVFVIGLMTAVADAALTRPAAAAGWLALAFAANFGLQAAAWGAGAALPRDARAALAIAAGNRNIALFLAVLPPAALDSLLVFVGCYQIPMFLTPIVLRRIARI